MTLALVVPSELLTNTTTVYVLLTVRAVESTLKVRGSIVLAVVYSVSSTIGAGTSVP